jgi:hypothetical protein
MTVLAPSVRRVSPFTRVQTRAASVTAAVIAELLLKADRHERTRATDWRAVVRAAEQPLNNLRPSVRFPTGTAMVLVAFQP